MSRQTYSQTLAAWQAFSAPTQPGINPPQSPSSSLGAGFTQCTARGVVAFA